MRALWPSGKLRFSREARARIAPELLQRIRYGLVPLITPNAFQCISTVGYACTLVQKSVKLFYVASHGHAVWQSGAQETTLPDCHLGPPHGCTPSALRRAAS